MLSNVCALMVMALVSSCEKMVLADGAESGREEQGNVVLRVTQFEQTPFGALTGGEAGDYCSRLCFHVYDDEGVRVSYVNEKQEDTGYGTASLSLDAGHYYLVVVGHSGSSNPSFYANERVSVSGTQLGDTFWCCEELEVGDEEIERDLVLHRIVSLVRFLPADERPENLNQVIFSYQGSRGTFDGLTGYGSTNARQNYELNLTTDHDDIQFYTIPRAFRDEIDLDVKTYYVEDNGRVHSLTAKTISGVPIQRNSVTICRGNLFDNRSSTKSAFITVSVDGEWGEDINLSF